MDQRVDQPKFLKIKVNKNNDLSEKNGGDEGIRTLDELLAHTPLAGERLRPLGHVSVGGNSDLCVVGQATNEFYSRLYGGSKR